MDEQFENLEQQLELLIETSRQLGIMVSDFQPQTQSALNQKIQTLATCLKELDTSKDNFKDVQVPMQVFDYIDNGKNPLLFTKDCLMKTLKKNEEIKGKIVTFNQFHDLLLGELEKSFPSEFQTYRKLRVDPSTIATSSAVINENPNNDNMME